MSAWWPGIRPNKNGAGLAILLAGVAWTQTAVAQPMEQYQPPHTPDAAEWSATRVNDFMRELTAFVVDNHTVRDPERMVHGMSYEFWKDGRQIQVFSLDAMHDGAWFMGSLAVAHRADPDGPYLDLAQQYKAPFYVNVISNSDRLFPIMPKAQEDLEPLPHPVKGWVPRGWDDGQGYDKGSGKKFSEEFGHADHDHTTIIRDDDGEFKYAYFTPSNHLAQDLADTMLNLWKTTRDPGLRDAVGHVREYRNTFGSVKQIGAIEFAYGSMQEPPDKSEWSKLPRFQPDQMAPYYTGMYEQKGHPLPSYEDGLAWRYRMAATEAALGGTFPIDFAEYAAARVYSHAMGLEQYYDDRPYQFGMFFFDLQAQPKFIEGEGRLDRYLTDGKAIFGARGIQFAWVAAGILPVLKENPGLWGAYQQKNHPDVPLVRFVDEPPATDGRRDESYDKSATIGPDDARVTLLSDPKHLHLFIEATADEVSLEITPAAAVVGDKGIGRVQVSRTGEVKVTNAGGEELVHRASSSKEGEGAGWTAEISIPYTVVRGQKHWINGVEHGRYEVTINGEPSGEIYMLSEHDRMVRWLERFVLGTLDTWHGVWEQLGIIPSGYRSPQQEAPTWEVSDSGNYAALIQTLALWNIYQAGKTEWGVIKEQTPVEPKLHQPLPESVIQAQGLTNID